MIMFCFHIGYLDSMKGLTGLETPAKVTKNEGYNKRGPDNPNR